MTEEFKTGDSVRLSDDELFHIDKKIGEGGQGFVYKGIYRGEEAVLKWYKNIPMIRNPEFKKNLCDLAKNGSPHPMFIWPLALSDDRCGSYGYVMPLVPPEYRQFTEFLTARARFQSLGSRITAGLYIAECFRVLHNQGYSYQDLNDGNFFIHPETGEIRICDNENIAPYGHSYGIQGKARYMAPEVVTKKKRPDVHTDRFSMAVILFMMFFADHPLEGRRTLCPCLSEEIQTETFGRHPVFCMDPANDSNRPVPEVHRNVIRLWDRYPQYFRDLFIKSFSRECLTGADTEHRVIEKQWIEALLRLRAHTVQCRCGGITVVEPGRGRGTRCINCGRPLQASLWLQSGTHTVTVMPGKYVYLSDLRTSGEFMQKLGTVRLNPRHPGLLGLRNESGGVLNCTKPDGAAVAVPEGRFVPLMKGVTINKDKIQIEVRAYETKSHILHARTDLPPSSGEGAIHIIRGVSG